MQTGIPERLARPLRSSDAKGPNFHAKEKEERRAPFARYGYAMEDRNLLSVLEKRVREVEQLAADCILDGDVMRLEQSVAQYRKKARVPVSKRVKVWPPASRRTASFGWPRG